MRMIRNNKFNKHSFSLGVIITFENLTMVKVGGRKALNRD